MPVGAIGSATPMGRDLANDPETKSAAPSKEDARKAAFLLNLSSYQAPAKPDLPPTTPLTRVPGDDASEYLIPLEPPGPQRIFYRLESEASLQERMRQEARERSVPEKISFPEEPVVSTQAYSGRSFAPNCATAEANYVLYRKLFFEQKNLERYGWDLGPVGPVVSAGKFYWDLVFFPYHLASKPCRRFESNAGLCLPGDPVPFTLYPPNLNLPGTVVEAGVIVAIIACFP